MPNIQRIAIASVLLAGCLAGTLLIWWRCERSDSVAYLPHHADAEWIIYPKPVEATKRSAFPISAEFRRSLVLPAQPDLAVLTFCAFKSTSITINGKTVSASLSEPHNWKSPHSADVSALIQSGTNEISVVVTNSFGPPALWLRLDLSNSQTQSGLTGLANSLSSNTNWSVSLAGAAWRNAHLADQPLEIESGNALYGSETTFDSARRLWLAVAVISIISLLVVAPTSTAMVGASLPAFVRLRRGRRRLLRANGGTLTRVRGILSPTSLLILVLIARGAIFFHNLPLLPRSKGFDSEGHQEYIQFIQQHHALPLAKDGWEMFQPPLYYVAGAALLGVCGVSVSDDAAGLLLPLINGIAGLIHCWLAFLCLRLLFPGNVAAQVIGLLVVSFLPPHIYLSQYITNEPLAGLFVTLALYCFLRSSADGGIRWQMATGVALGAAMLTKFSTLLAIPIFLAAVVFQKTECSSRRKEAHFNPAPKIQSLLTSATTIFMKRGIISRVACILIPCVLVCGWHYIRVWIDSGQPLVGNWDENSPFAWQQDPGFRTSSFYLKFGQALISPFFSAIHSFADGIYSTLWGDGLAGGATRLIARPPWNWDWMNAGYVLAIGPSLLALIGFILAAGRFIRHPEAQGFVVLGMISVFALGVIYMSLQVPSYAQVKAFYAFPALVPCSFLAASGWQWLARKSRALGALLLALLITWSCAACVTFWIQKHRPATVLASALYFTEPPRFLGRQRDADAVATLSYALLLSKSAQPKDRLSTAGQTEAHFNLGLVLDRQGITAEAVGQYRDALGLDPNFHGALNNLAWILAANAEDTVRNGTEAVRLAEQACDLTLNLYTTYIGTLAAAYAEAGRFDDAIKTAQRAIDCARLRHEPELADANQRLLELYRAHKPFHEKKVSELMN